MKIFLRIALVALPAVSLLGCGKAQPPDLGKQVGRWVQALHDPDARVRKNAILKLGNIGPGDAAVFPALLRALKDRDAGVRREAILALLKCGPEAREAVPALTEVRRHDRDAQLRDFAARALEKLRTGPASPSD
jgi:HEAT repeat protein